MGEVHSVFRAIKGWIQGDGGEGRKMTGGRECSAARSDRERSCDSFLANEPVLLRDLLIDTSTEHDLVGVACTMNRLVFLYLIARCINTQLWTLVEAGSSYVARQ